MRLEFRILGQLEVVAGGDPLRLGSAQQQAVLVLLLVRVPEPLSVDELIDAVWPGRPPASAEHAVQVQVSRIRKLLRGTGAEVDLLRRGAAYVLEVDPQQIDARRFEAIVREAGRAMPDDAGRARSLLEEALRLWRAPPLGEFLDLGPANREAERLEQLHALAVEELAEARMACGEHREVIAMLSDLVAQNPLRERPRRLLMLSLYRAGRHAEALAAYRDVCQALAEVGLGPGLELRQLEVAILRHDASLTPPVRLLRSAGGPMSRGIPARKVVTALFVDLSPPDLPDDRDPERLHKVTTRCFEAVRELIKRHGGTMERFGVDEVTALFGVPQVHEDDAVRAVLAAYRIRKELRTIAHQAGTAFGFRAAVNTGLVLYAGGETPTLGAAVAVAARILRAAPEGDILVGEATLGLVRDAVRVEPFGPVALKGSLDPVVAYRLVHVDPLIPGYARRFDVPLVGRERELEMLRVIWGQSVTQSACRLLTVLGDPGVGKSRLVAELLASVGDRATVLRGRCLHYGEGITFSPLVEALAPLGQPARSVLDRLQSGGSASAQEMFFEVRTFLETLAAERPVVLHVDDLQWAQPMLLDLLDHIVALSTDVPIFLVCAARGDLFEHRPTWGDEQPNVAKLVLDPLLVADCKALLDVLGDRLGDDLRPRVIAASEGNPLFLEQLAAFVRERGTGTLPPTVHALLSARIESIPAPERRILELGAVEGEVFHQAAIHALSAGPPADLDRRLQALSRKELIRRHPATLDGEEAFRFRHLLLRDVVYDTLTKSTRGELHERFARWMESTANHRPEMDEIAGWHLEQSVRYHQDVHGNFDVELATSGARHLHTAGQRAIRRADMAAARALLERARTLASTDPALSLRIGVDLAEALMEGGHLARVDELLCAAEENPPTAARAALVRLHWLALAKPTESVDAIEDALPETLERLEADGDDQGLAKAHLVAFWAKTQRRVDIGAAAHAARLAVDHARRAADEGLRSQALAMYVVTLYYGHDDPATIAAQLDAIEYDVDAGPYLASMITTVRGEIARLSGDLDECRRLMRVGIERFQTMGIHTMAAAIETCLALAELSHGDPESTLPGLLSADAHLARFGERAFRSTVQATLAQVYERLGNLDPARASLGLSDEIGADDDSFTVAIAAAVRDRLALREDDPHAAERWARHGLEHALKTNIPFVEASANLELARVLSARGRQNDARHSAQTAVRILEAKGDRPRIAAARALIEQLQTTGTPV